MATPLVQIFLNSSSISEDTATALFHPITGGVSGGVIILLLIGTYMRLRKLVGAEFLSLLCAYTVMSIAIGIVGAFVVGSLQIANRVGTPGVLLPVVPTWPSSIVPATLALALLSLAITLWFAHKASRLSLRHAYFLVLIGTLAFSSVDGPIRTLVVRGLPLEIILGTTAYGAALISSALWLAETVLIILPLALLGIWLLGNFTSRSPTFQWLTVAGLFGYMALLSAVLPSAIFFFFERTIAEIAIIVGVMALSILVVAAPFPLIYLVRVRTVVTTPDPHSTA